MLVVSGGVGGLAGGVETLGVHHRFMEGSAPGFGFDGLIAALLANGIADRDDRHRAVLRRAALAARSCWRPTPPRRARSSP